MYKITTTAGETFTAEKIHYIKKHSNGSFVFCKEGEAEGIACGGNAYLFAEGNSFHEVDTGHTLDEMTAQLVLADETAIELYETNLVMEETNAAQDEALIELYEMIGG